MARSADTPAARHTMERKLRIMMTIRSSRSWSIAGQSAVDPDRSRSYRGVRSRHDAGGNILGGTPMKQYLLSIYQPDGDPPPAPALERIMRDVHALRQEMKAAGAWVFASGLYPSSTATVVRLKDGDLLTTDGPFTEGKEHIGGVSIVTAPA